MVLGLGFMLKFFVIGEPVDGEQIYFTISENGRELELQIDTVESAMALRGWKYRQDDGILYISARKVPVSLFYDEGRYKTTINTEMIETIILGNKTIWSNSK